MGKSLAIVAGLGKTGQSVIRHLLARGWQVAATDTRVDPPGLAQLREAEPALRISTGGLDAALLQDADLVVASPGLPQSDAFFAAARARGIEVVGDVELFARGHRGRVVGITGTNGKSTVTSLVALMGEYAGLTTRAGGNLGEPALDLLQGVPADLYVLELSSYQLETTHSLQLAAATVLNVTPDHLDRYVDVAAYAAAKARIFAHCAVTVINLDDELVAAMPGPSQRVLSFSLRPDSGADYVLRQMEGRDWLCAGREPLLPMDAMRIVGRHNAANALAALALGDALGLDRGAMFRALREFPGLPHRAAWVADIAGVRYVNDSKGTNVGATLAAVAGFSGPLLIIAGGEGKNQNFGPLRAAFEGKVRRVLLIGRDAEAMARALEGSCETELCSSLEAAVAAASRAARPGDTVLLSPACASLDMFRDYTHRGEVFADAVRKLAA